MFAHSFSAARVIWWMKSIVDPVYYWKSHALQFPLLSIVAKNVLVIPCSSVAVKRCGCDMMDFAGIVWSQTLCRRRVMPEIKHFLHYVGSDVVQKCPEKTLHFSRVLVYLEITNLYGRISDIYPNPIRKTGSDPDTGYVTSRVAFPFLFLNQLCIIILLALQEVPQSVTHGSWLWFFRFLRPSSSRAVNAFSDWAINFCEEICSSPPAYEYIIDTFPSFKKICLQL